MASAVTLGPFEGERLRSLSASAHCNLLCRSRWLRALVWGATASKNSYCRSKSPKVSHFEKKRIKPTLVPILPGPPRSLCSLASSIF